MKGFRGHLAVTITGGLEEIVTPWAGASTPVETYRRYGAGDAADRALPRKKTTKGFNQLRFMRRVPSSPALIRWGDVYGLMVSHLTT